jgi:hypothetical protein
MKPLAPPVPALQDLPTSVPGFAASVWPCSLPLAIVKIARCFDWGAPRCSIAANSSPPATGLAATLALRSPLLAQLEKAPANLPDHSLRDKNEGAYWAELRQEKIAAKITYSTNYDNIAM